MAKKASKKLNEDGTMTMEELEALQNSMNKDKKKEEENPDAGPVAPPQEPPMNPHTPDETPPVVENTDTIILTGDAENPIVIVVPNDPPEGTVETPEIDPNGTGNTGGTDA